MFLDYSVILIQYYTIISDIFHINPIFIQFVHNAHAIIMDISSEICVVTLVLMLIDFSRSVPPPHPPLTHGARRQDHIPQHSPSHRWTHSRAKHSNVFSKHFKIPLFNISELLAIRLNDNPARGVFRGGEGGGQQDKIMWKRHKVESWIMINTGQDL